MYALQGAAGGEPDPYNRPTIYTVANPALKLNKSYKIGVDGIFIKNDTNGNSLLPIIGKFAVLYTDGIISLNTASILTRITMLISASDDKTKQSADEFLKRYWTVIFRYRGKRLFQGREYADSSHQQHPVYNATCGTCAILQGEYVERVGTKCQLQHEA